MKSSIIAVLAAASLLAACETATTEQAATGGGGTGPSATGPRPGSQEDLVANVGDRVLFDYDRVTVRADQRPVLDRQSAWLQRYPQVRVAVEGHADERGTREYNLALGQRRANSARDVLVAGGVASARIQTISFGKDRPAQLGSDEASWTANRRAVTVVQ
jgi:peptidoglycan-associated lipoprotein